MELDNFHLVLKLNVRWNVVVGVATRYRMDCPEIESQWGGDFPPPSSPALRPALSPVQREKPHFPGGKADGAWR